MYLVIITVTQTTRTRHPQLTDDLMKRKRSILRPFCSGFAHTLDFFFLILISRGIDLEAKALVS